MRYFRKKARIINPFSRSHEYNRVMRLSHMDVGIAESSFLAAFEEMADSSIQE
jgi:hypothetical protein